MSQRERADLEALADLRTPWCIHVVATLRIAGHIAAGATEIASLAAAAGCDAGALGGVLAHLASRGVFEETAPGHFALNDAARGLLDESRLMSLDINGIGGRMAYAWGSLLGYVRTGTPHYSDVFGLPFWEDLEANPQVSASFDALIGPGGHGDFNPEFAIIGGWEPVRTVVDVGGGTGAMLAAMLRARPQIHGTLIDLPRTVARAAATFDAAGVTARVTTVGQSFLEPLPAGADLYLLRGVLNDWPDREAISILRHCAEAARPGGRVVVLKSVRPSRGTPPVEIEMVLLGGKHRSVPQFQVLAREAGLSISVAAQQPSGYFVVECHPA